MYDEDLTIVVKCVAILGTATVRYVPMYGLLIICHRGIVLNL